MRAKSRARRRCANCKEETGTDKAEIIAEMDDWITYDLPAHLVGVAFHGRYQAASARNGSPCASSARTATSISAHEPEFSDWKWVDLEALPGLIVPFKRDTYKAVIAASAANDA